MLVRGEFFECHGVNNDINSRFLNVVGGSTSIGFFCLISSVEGVKVEISKQKLT